MIATGRKKEIGKKEKKKGKPNISFVMCINRKSGTGAKYSGKKKKSETSIVEHIIHCNNLNFFSSFFFF
jgi:hypothetical protein